MNKFYETLLSKQKFTLLFLLIASPLAFASSGGLDSVTDAVNNIEKWVLILVVPIGVIWCTVIGFGIKLERKTWQDLLIAASIFVGICAVPEVVLWIHSLFPQNT